MKTNTTQENGIKGLNGLIELTKETFKELDNKNPIIKELEKQGVFN